MRGMNVPFCKRPRITPRQAAPLAEVTSFRQGERPRQSEAAITASDPTFIRHPSMSADPAPKEPPMKVDSAWLGGGALGRRFGQLALNSL